MQCKFNETKECINTKLFEKWAHDEKETAWLTIGVCPNCPIYQGDLDNEEVKSETTQGRP
jgi:hypothetical protein